MSSPHGVANTDRLCLHNLSFGVSKATIAQELVNCGFDYVTEDDVNVIRKGMCHKEKLCTAFVTMASAAHVQLGIQLLHGRLVPSCSWKALRAETALPRLNTLKCNSGTSSSSSAAPEPPAPSEGQAAGHHLMHVKKEESQLENAFLDELRVYSEEPKKKKDKKSKDKGSKDLEVSGTPWERRLKQRKADPDF